MQNLSEDELLLLKKLGITLGDIKKEIKKRERSKTAVSIELSNVSAKVVRNCLCCGHTDISYVDYVKRADCEGYALHTVNSPTHAVTREHISDTIYCSHCLDEKLMGWDKESLVTMIRNLRKQLMKGER
jgi:hypothetical protein